MKHVLEQWVVAPGFEGYYEVSNLGRVRSIDRIVTDKLGRHKRLLKGAIMTPRKDRDGYLIVHFRYKGKDYPNIKMHRLVAQAFIPNGDNLPYVNHKDFDRTNNEVSNLEWCTAKQNVNYSRKAGRIRNWTAGKFGKENKQSRLLLMYDLHGNYIRSFYGAREAAEFLGMKTYVNIYMFLAGKRKNAYGHLWKIGNRTEHGATVPLPDDDKYKDFKALYS